MSDGRQHRFETLDAMRGIAAVLVVIFHCNVSFSTVPLAPGAYLAVDMFFALSGFVIAHAYDAKLQRMSATTFMVERLIRLYPLYIAGTAIAVAFTLFRLRFDPPHHIDDPIKTHLAAITFFAALLLPYFGTTYLYPFNGPAWSLFYELVVNCLYAVFHRALSVPALAAICIISAVIFAIESVRTGQTGGFWWSGWPAALSGAIYSFSAGVLIYRAGLPDMRIPAVSGFVVCAMMTGLLLARFEGDVRTVFDIGFVIAASPSLVIFGSRAATDPRYATALGELSYPIYAIHVPLLQLSSYLASRLEISALVSSLVFAAALIGTSTTLLLVYDRPIRKRLRRRVRSTAAF